jgi:hypothetical protein
MNMHTIKDRLQPLMVGKDITMTSICLGRRAELMGEISHNTVFVDDSTNLTATVDNVMRYSTGVIAQSVEMSVDTSSGPRPYFLAQVLPASTTEPRDSRLLHPSVTISPPDDRSMAGITKYINEREVSEAGTHGVAWRGSYLACKDSESILCPVVDVSGVSNVYCHEGTLCYGSPLHFIVRMSCANSVTVKVNGGSAMLSADPVVLRGYDAINTTSEAEHVAKVHRWNCWMAYMYQCMENISGDELTAIVALAPTARHRNHITQQRALLQMNDRRTSAHYRSMHQSEIHLQRCVHRET